MEKYAVVAKKLTKYKLRFVKESQNKIPRTRKYKIDSIHTAPTCVANPAPNSPAGMIEEFVISGFRLLFTIPQKFNK